MKKKPAKEHASQHIVLAGVPDEIEVSRLLLDPDNPRLADRLNKNPTQKEICSVLWSEGETSELVMSIAYNSFFKNEPLIIIPEKDVSDQATGKFVVIEGNRRLAAVQILLNNELRAELKATDVPEIDPAAQGRLTKLPVLRFDSRKDLWPYLGFRHINGPQSWDPFSKATYIAEVHEHQKIPLAEIARRIGDRNVTVKRLYRGLVILRQAELQTDFHRDDHNAKRFNFSHLYTALDYKEFQQHIGISEDPELPQNPVPKKKIGNLEELMFWLYGSKKRHLDPLIKSQYPDLGHLRDAIGNQDGLDNLRAIRSLQKAYEAALGDELIFRNALQNSKESVSTAVGRFALAYQGQTDLRRMVRDIFHQAQKLMKDAEEHDLQGQQKLPL